MAYKFNGTSQYLKATYGTFSLPLTIACWFYRGSSGQGALVELGSDTSGDAFMIYDGGGFFYALSYDNPVIQQSGLSTSMKNNAWNHGVGVFTSTTLRTAYLNGIAGAASTSTSIVTGVDLIITGAQVVAGAYSYYYPQSIAEVAIWDIDLTAAEVSSLAKGMSPSLVRPQNLIYYTPMIRDLNDLSGALSITNQNTATVSAHPKIYGL